MSFKEISSWLVLFGMGIVFGLYGWTLWQAGGFDAAATKMMFVTMVAFVVILVTAHIAIAILVPRTAGEAPDERDQRIELHAERAGGFAFGGVAFVILVLAVRDGQYLIANAIFLGFIGSEIVKNLWQVALYRRDA